MAALDRYTKNLMDPRAPGTGCHPWIFSTANLGVMAGLCGDQIHSDIRQAVPMGVRRIPDREIQGAINKALADFRNGGTYSRPKPAPVVKDGKAALQKIIAQGTICNDADLWEDSPIRLWDAP